MRRALADAEGALKAAREIGHAATFEVCVIIYPHQPRFTRTPHERSIHAKFTARRISHRGCRFHFTSALKSLADLSTRL